jgi:hypothetical protein
MMYKVRLRARIRVDVLSDYRRHGATLATVVVVN